MRMSVPACPTLILALALALAGPAPAATNYFSAAGGLLDWTNGGTTNWGLVSGGPYTNIWVSYNEAIFEGAPGAVNIAGGANANHITFSVDGYSITNGTLTMGSPAPSTSITVSNGHTASIQSSIARAGGGTYLTKRGFGSLNLSGANNLPTGLAAYQGVLAITGGATTCSGEIWIGSTGGAGLSVADTNAGGTVLLGGGSLIAGGANFILGQVINGTNVVSRFVQTGGAFYYAGAWAGIANGGGVSRIELSGGTFTSTTASLTMGVRGHTVLEVAGTAQATVPSVTLGHAANGGTTNRIFLNGGVLEVHNIGKGGGAVATLDFNGGTLRARSNNPLFMQGLNAVTVQAGGGVLDTTNINITINQALLDGGGGLTKRGTGTLTLTAANGYTGLTTVDEGTLALTGSLAGAVSVSSGATLSGTGTVAGAVNSGGTLAPGFGAAGRLRLNSSYTQGAGGALALEVGGATPGSGFDQVTAGGPATLDGALNVALINSFVPDGLSFELLRAASVSGTFATTNLPVLTGNFAWAVQYTPTSVVLATVNTNQANLVWSPTLSGDWDLSTSTNWYDTVGALPSVFETGDAVTFTDAGAYSNQVRLAAALSPAVTRVTAGSNYVFAGPGALGGAGALIKEGTGTLVIATTNLFSGGTTISNGTIQLGDATAAGTLGSGPVTNDGTLAFGQAETVTLANPISGTGRVVQAGAGTTVLTATNTFAGGTAISAGTLQLGSGGLLGALGAGPVTNDGTLAFNHSDTIAFPNAIAGAGSVVKAGGGTLILTATNTYSGLTTISGGTLVAGDGATAGSLGTNAVVDQGTLAFQRSDQVTAPALSGTGSLVQAGSGTLRVDREIGLQGALAASNGLLEIVAGGAITNAGRVVVAGPGSTTLVLNGGLVTATNGGSNAAGNFYVAGAAGTFGTVIISNGIFRCPNGNGLPTVGDFGNATIRQYGGEVNIAGGLYLANNGGTSSIELEGGRFVNSTLLIGVRGLGVLTISGTATAALQSLSFAHPATTGTGILNLNGGVLQVAARIEKPNVGAAATFNFNGGVLRAGGDSTNFMQGLNTASVLAGGAFVDTAGFAIRIAQPLADAGGGLTKLGAGTLTLDGASTYTGPTAISAGTLRVHGSLAAGSTVTVDAGATLGGTGQVQGVALVSGTVEPGPGGGLTIGLDLTMLPGAAAHFVLGGTNAADFTRVRVIGFATVDGTLRASLTNGYLPAAGDSFTLLTSDAQAVFGGFTAFDLPALDPGFGWQVDYPGSAAVALTVTGAPVVVATPYEQWAQSIPNPAERGEQADPDGDGYANLLEYSQGTDATNSADNAKLSLVRTNGQFLVLFNRVNSATDIVYEVEGAYLPTNNATWLGIATNVIGSWGGSTNVNDNNTAAVHRVLVTDLLIGTNRSLRLKVTRP